MPTGAVHDRSSDDSCEGSSAGGTPIAGANGWIEGVKDELGTWNDIATGTCEEMMDFWR